MLQVGCVTATSACASRPVKSDAERLHWSLVAVRALRGCSVAAVRKACFAVPELATTITTDPLARTDALCPFVQQLWDRCAAERFATHEGSGDQNLKTHRSLHHLKIWKKARTRIHFTSFRAEGDSEPLLGA